MAISLIDFGSMSVNACFQQLSWYAVTLIVRKIGNDLFEAEATPPHAKQDWSTTEPLPVDRLIEQLKDHGCHQTFRLGIGSPWMCWWLPLPVSGSQMPFKRFSQLCFLLLSRANIAVQRQVISAQGAVCASDFAIQDQPRDWLWTRVRHQETL